jgi:excinuclease ABC subunit A
VLDEPSIGLHQRDNDRLLATLKHLRDLGNSVIVVEHDQDAILAADYVVDMGPGAGEHGGQVVAQGTPEDIRRAPHSLTGHYLAGHRQIPMPERRHRPDPGRRMVISGAAGNNLKSVTLTLPVGLFVCVTGVSGSGKSTLINDTLYHAVARHLYGSTA